MSPSQFIKCSATVYSLVADMLTLRCVCVSSCLRIVCCHRTLSCLLSRCMLLKIVLVVVKVVEVSEVSVIRVLPNHATTLVWNTDLIPAALMPDIETSTILMTDPDPTSRLSTTVTCRPIVTQVISAVPSAACRMIVCV